MQIFVKVIAVGGRSTSGLRGVVQLSAGDWDDYSFKTSFRVTFWDFHGNAVDLGTVKVGYVNQLPGWTVATMLETFDRLPEGWFSLGQDVDYYKTAQSKLNATARAQIFSALRDVVADESSLLIAQQQRVFKDSLTRFVSPSTIHGQFMRILRGEVELTDFQFTYEQEADERHAPVKLTFAVEAASKPPTNVHVLIGRNGVGKTTLLNNMVGALLNVVRPNQPTGRFYNKPFPFAEVPLSKDYFSSVISVSFSAFDPFIPPPDRPADRTLGPAYFYVGMKKVRSDQTSAIRPAPKTELELVNDFAVSFKSCLSQSAKRVRWLAAIKRLESDRNFEEMDLGRLLELEDNIAVEKAHAMASRMSSGHSIVLLTITLLVDAVEEKTLVLLDEPESHLHPPLLSAFTRALSDLLYARNGVAIVATHSPVVLQEVPRSCVWKLMRVRTQGQAERPERETFGENVGILTRETFGLEVSKSGFHEMLQSAVQAGGTFESIVKEYNNQLGAEAKAILLSQIAARESGKVNE